MSGEARLCGHYYAGGGAVANYRGILTVTNSTISGNSPQCWRRRGQLATVTVTINQQHHLG